MEGWGITSIEANACGVPVVASDVPGLRDSVRNPHTGYLVEYGNAEKFAEKILHILMNRDVHDRMRDNSLAWARNFDWDRSAARSLAILYGQPAE
jgi:glycosyltransferase involved in cell wall biosynthesis